MLGSGGRMGEEGKGTVPARGVYSVKEEPACSQYLAGSGQIFQAKGSHHIWKRETVKQ